MNKEEKEAIEYLKKYIEWETHGERSLETDILTVLNLIQKQEKIIENLIQEKENKDETIDLMAKEILRLDAEKSIFVYDHARMWDTETGIKEYFTKKESESNE